MQALRHVAVVAARGGQRGAAMPMRDCGCSRVATATAMTSFNASAMRFSTTEEKDQPRASMTYEDMVRPSSNSINNAVCECFQQMSHRSPHIFF